jgi:type III pantothenate kinase
MILDLDVGNSRIKALVHRPGEEPERGIFATVEQLLKYLDDRGLLPQRVRASCVANPDQLDLLDAWLAEHHLSLVARAKSSPYAANVHNGYAAPEQLGVDRWLAVCAAWNRCARPLVVVDAGSAMTIDRVAAAGLHQGGYIVPGLAMQQSSLLANTRQVRFEQSSSAATTAPGRNTKEAVNHGITLMLTAMIERAVADFCQDTGGEVALVLTGGDAPLLRKFLQLPCDLEPDLVLHGLGLVLD